MIEMRCTTWTESRTQLIEKVNCMIECPCNFSDEEVCRLHNGYRGGIYRLSVDEEQRSYVRGMRDLRNDCPTPSKKNQSKYSGQMQRMDEL